MIPLFKRYPGLNKNLPHISLCNLPTPIKKAARLAENLGLKNLFIKQDDASADLYGGNKIRKLEFLLGQALAKNHKEVMTFGFAGSNHALATSIYAQKVGLGSISMLLPQHNADYVRKNLLMGHQVGAEFHLSAGMKSVIAAAGFQMIRHKITCGAFPYFIPPGGSSPLGTVGFVNAAFELLEQVSRGVMPEPDKIYVALGSAGTAVGLMIGLMAAGAKTTVVPVRVVDRQFMNEKSVHKAFGKTVALLRKADPTFPDLQIASDQIHIAHDFFGDGYGMFTEQGIEAMTLMKENEGINLDGTYTGKAMSALIAHARAKTVADQTVLFWNTLNSVDFSNRIKGMDYHALPAFLYPYFQSATQEERVARQGPPPND